MWNIYIYILLVCLLCQKYLLFLILWIYRFLYEFTISDKINSLTKQHKNSKVWITILKSKIIFMKSQATTEVTLKISVLSNLCHTVWKKHTSICEKLSVFINNAVNDNSNKPNRMCWGLTAIALLIRGKHEVKRQHFGKHDSSLHHCCTQDYKYCLLYIWSLFKTLQRSHRRTLDISPKG